MADLRPLPGRGASNQDAAGHQDGAGHHDDLDDVDLIQQAWQRERPATPASSIGVVTRIWRIGKLLADERRRTLARLGIDAATLDLLSTLRRAGPPYRLTAGVLAGQSLVSAGAISQRVARAEREGLVRRERSAADGRLSYVTLTEAGHALVERSVDGLLAHEEALLSALTGEQRGQLSGQLKVLLASLSPYPGHLSNERRGHPPGLPSVPRLWQRARYERGVAEPGFRRAAGRSRGAHRAV